MTAQGQERSLTIHNVTPHFYPEIGGLEESVRRFGGWLVRRGHRVVVHSSSLSTSGTSLPAGGSIDGIEIRRYAPSRNRGYFRTWFQPDLSGAQLLHLHGYAVRTNDRVVRTLGDRQIVFSLHHGVRMPHTAPLTWFLRRGYDVFVGVPTLRRVRCIVVPSPGDRAWLTAHRVPAERVRILPTPLLEDAFDAGDPAWARERIGTTPFVLYLGRLHSEKGVDDLLETVPYLPTKVRLAFAGPDAGRLETLRKRARELKITDRVLFLGVVTEAQKRSLLAACTALALPSLFEAQGLAVLEAWAQGRPVIASDVGALSELVVPGETGILVPHADVLSLASGLRELLEHPERGDKMGRRGQAFVQQFRLEKLGLALESIYREVAAALMPHRF